MDPSVVQASQTECDENSMYAIPPDAMDKQPAPNQPSVTDASVANEAPVNHPEEKRVGAGSAPEEDDHIYEDIQSYDSLPSGAPTVSPLQDPPPPTSITHPRAIIRGAARPHLAPPPPPSSSPEQQSHSTATDAPTVTHTQSHSTATDAPTMAAPPVTPPQSPTTTMVAPPVIPLQSPSTATQGTDPQSPSATQGTDPQSPSATQGTDPSQGLQTPVQGLGPGTEQKSDTFLERMKKAETAADKFNEVKTSMVNGAQKIGVIINEKIRSLNTKNKDSYGTGTNGPVVQSGMSTQPVPVYPQSPTATQPQAVYPQSPTATQPLPVYPQSPTATQPLLVYPQSPTATQPQVVSPHSLVATQPVAAQSSLETHGIPMGAQTQDVQSPMAQVPLATMPTMPPQGPVLVQPQMAAAPSNQSQLQGPGLLIVSGSLGDQPCVTACTNCGTRVMTRVVYKSGPFSWLMCTTCVLFGQVFGCCVLPFFIDSFKDAYHYCPDCGNTLHVHKRI